MNKLKKLIMLLAVSIVMTTSSTSYAQSIELPLTGQTICYDSAGIVIPCAGTGQDGELQMGITWPNPRFVDNGDGTVTDNLTGLIWLQNANCFLGKTWAEALFEANTLNTGECGLADGSIEGDWRLPNVYEIESLINLGEADPASWLNAQGFINVLPWWYWTSTTLAWDAERAWMLNAMDGSVNGNAKMDSHFIWPVRGESLTAPANIWRTGQTSSYYAGDDGEYRAGIPWPSPRFIDNGDGTVTDNLTGLIWLQDSNCLGKKNWSQALNDVKFLNSGECGLSDGSEEGDWRLPNRKEFLSLIDRSNYLPALPDDHLFHNVKSFWHWTSTTYAYDPAYAWMINIWGGCLRAALTKEDGLLYVWPVRGEQESETALDLTGSWTFFEMTSTRVRGVLRVENAGATEYLGPVNVDIYYSFDEVFDPGDTFVYKTTINIAGEIAYLSFVRRINTMSYVIAVIDPENNILEIDEENNVIVSPTS